MQNELNNLIDSLNGLTPTSEPRPYPACTPEPAQYRQVPIHKKHKEPNSDMYKEHDTELTRLLIIAFCICCFIAIYLLL